MRILALENSTSSGGIALWRDGALEWEKTFTAARGRSAALFAHLREVLDTQSAPTRIAVGTGPGSYNGIRVALAAGKGIQMARGLEFVAISSALCLPGKDYIYFGDARAGQYHFSQVSGGRFQAGPRLMSPEELREALESVSCAVFSDMEHEGLPKHAVAHPSAGILAGLAADTAPQDTMAEPLYLKPPHVTVPRSARGCNQAGSG